MALSHELLSQFAKLVTKTNNTNTESTVYGTIVVDSEGNKYVKLDGSDQLTPLSDDERPIADSATANANEGERVSVLIKNHTATVTGNVSSPAARSGDVEELGDQVSKIQEFDILIGEQIQAQEGYIQKLQADKANVSELIAAQAKITELEATKATIAELNAVKATVDDLEANRIDADIINAKFVTIDGELEAVSADIDNLSGDYAVFKETTTDSLTAYDAEITRLETEKLSAEQADVKYANIDFANIGEAAITKLFSESGIIEDIIVSEGKITGELVGVTIKGDLIEAGTLKADKLVVKGSDGIYYKLNFESGNFKDGETIPDDGLHGSVIVANSITAEKIAVDDLVAFDATIGGFHITNNSIYSGVKESATNTTTGVYLGDDGQIAFGDETNFIKYYKDQNGAYRLEIAADSILLGSNKTDIESSLGGSIEIGARNLIRNSLDLIFDEYYFDVSIVSSHDGNGNVVVETQGVTVTHDGNGNVTIEYNNANVTYDDNGNVTVG